MANDSQTPSEIEKNPAMSAVDLSSFQIEFARSLGLEPANDEAGPAFVQRLEQHLGQESMLQLARWFLMSVLQHLQGSAWQSIHVAGIDESQQYALAREFVARDEFKQSLLVVLKDPRFRFTLVSFAKTRNPEKRVLSSTTKAFRHGKEILQRNGLVGPQTSKRKTRRSTVKKSPRVDTAVNRRAARRISLAQSSDTMLNDNPHTLDAAASGNMSEEEFVELDKALGAGDLKAGQAFTYNTNEERFSLLMGALAGAGVFLLALLLFL